LSLNNDIEYYKRDKIMMNEDINNKNKCITEKDNIIEDLTFTNSDLDNQRILLKNSCDQLESEMSNKNDIITKLYVKMDEIE
jgi:hypothetical protein